MQCRGRSRRGTFRGVVSWETGNGLAGWKRGWQPAGTSAIEQGRNGGAGRVSAVETCAASLAWHTGNAPSVSEPRAESPGLERRRCRAVHELRYPNGWGFAVQCCPYCHAGTFQQCGRTIPTPRTRLGSTRRVMTGSH